jgi:hypothetical protein
MVNNQPRFATKDELRATAMREFGVSKNSFDYGWIDAIETAGPAGLVPAAAASTAN